jgi:hypothetical protein
MTESEYNTKHDALLSQLRTYAYFLQSNNRPQYELIGLAYKAWKQVETYRSRPARKLDVFPGKEGQ